MSRGLRYLNMEQMPEGMRRAIARSRLAEANEQKRAPAAPRAPRRDEEHEQQVVLMNRLAALAANKPQYALAVARTHAIPNGGGRSRREAGRLKAEGVRRGVPDIFVAVPSKSFCGLYIEMKTPTGKVSDAQQAWIDDSRRLGYRARVCRSADAAMKVWLDYIGDLP